MLHRRTPSAESLSRHIFAASQSVSRARGAWKSLLPKPPGEAPLFPRLEKSKRRPGRTSGPPLMGPYVFCPACPETCRMESTAKIPAAPAHGSSFTPRCRTLPDLMRCSSSAAAPTRCGSSLPCGPPATGQSPANWRFDEIKSAG
ncbi:hypothetical protein SDC9_80023 [bioreactor metagenome]|uniref:Uncharacterized protein n=1 Tax=bioreactor metagenome TaxID=1076179 RepID=A0A644YZH8_9ZZZZ